MPSIVIAGHDRVGGRIDEQAVLYDSGAGVRFACQGSSDAMCGGRWTGQQAASGSLPDGCRSSNRHVSRFVRFAIRLRGRAEALSSQVWGWRHRAGMLSNILSVMPSATSTALREIVIGAGRRREASRGRRLDGGRVRCVAPAQAGRATSLSSIHQRRPFPAQQVSRRPSTTVVTRLKMI